jgi:hypothetical protein
LLEWSGAFLTGDDGRLDGGWGGDDGKGSAGVGWRVGRGDDGEVGVNWLDGVGWWDHW